MGKRDEYVAWFSDLTKKDVEIAGLKGAYLAEAKRLVPVPEGFVVTSKAFRHFLEKNGIKNDIHRILGTMDLENIENVRQGSDKIRDLIIGSKMPADLERDILDAYEILDDNNFRDSGAASEILRNAHEMPFVSVRSSIVTDEENSFAGLCDSFLSVKGSESLIEKVKECFASLFSPETLVYKEKKGIDMQKGSMPVVVQRIVDAQKSGVVFSKNPLFDDKNFVIESVWGLGCGMSIGNVLADYYLLGKNFELLEGRIADKKVAFARNSSGKIGEVKLADKSSQRVLNQYELKRLSQFSQELEEHFGFPIEMDFVVENEGFLILQVRPITSKPKDILSETLGNVLFSGVAGGYGIKSGTARVIGNPEDFKKIKRGEIVILNELTWNPELTVVGGVVSNLGGMGNNAAVLYREFGIPVVTASRVATEKIRDGDVISIDGLSGRVVEGRIEEVKKDVKPVLSTKTRIKLHLTSGDYAIKAQETGAKHVGLVRVDDLISDSGTHSVAYLKRNNLGEYIDLIHSGLKKISSGFDEVWVKASDSRSEEFRNLSGAPGNQEGNPMLGFRGVRFGLKNQDLLEADFKAVREVADEFPGKRFGLVLGHVISPDEIKEAKKVFDKIGIPGNVSLGSVIETPASVEMVEEICQEVKFVNLDLDNLAQYVLALDKNNSEIQDMYNEMNPAVLKVVRRVIDACKRKGVEVCASGDAVLQNDVLRFLVERGIDGVITDAGDAHGVSEVVKSAEIELNRGIRRVDESDADEENLILSALDEEPEEDKLIPLDDYNPGVPKKQQIPELNDAIPVDSGELNRKEEKVMDFSELSDKGRLDDDSEGDDEKPMDESEEEVGYVMEDNQGDEELGDNQQGDKGGLDDSSGENVVSEMKDGVRDNYGMIDEKHDGEKEEDIGEQDNKEKTDGAISDISDLANAAMDYEVEEEVQESEAREALIKAEFGGEKEPEKKDSEEKKEDKREFLNIF